MKNIAVVLFLAIATVSVASDLRSLRPKKVTQSYPELGFEVTASIAKGDTLDMSLVVGGENIEVPEEALKGIKSPQLETLAFASFSSTGRALERDHLRNGNLVVTLQFGGVRSHGECGVTEVAVYSHVTFYFDPEGFEGRSITIPNGNYSNSWKTIVEFDDFRDAKSPNTKSIEYPDPEFPNRWQTKEDIETARKEYAERKGGGLFPEEGEEQSGARQTATAPDSKSEDNQKSKPESEAQPE